MNDIGETKHTSCLIKGVFSPPEVADPGEGPGGGGAPPIFLDQTEARRSESG